MANKEVYEKVTARIIKALEEGTIPWEKPWANGANSWPRNAVTGRQYSGFNVWALMFSPYTCPGWLTFNQARAIKASVAKGEKGTPVFFMSVIQDKKDPDKRYFMAKGFTVFNVEQLQDSPAKAKLLAKLTVPMPVLPPDAHIAELEAIVSATGANITYGGDRAYYMPSADRIGMPKRAQFKSTDSYYGVLFHELGHWTGAEKRLARGLTTCFGNAEYAAEELVAELTAAFLCHRNGLEFETQSAGYIAHWLKGLNNDPGLLVKAASAAQKAADLIQPPVAPAVEELEEAA